MGDEMLTLNQLATYFPPELMRKNPQGILVEYLQHELLDSIFKEKASGLLNFIGGTAVRILYQSPRFSEDLDFDNFGLSFSQFENLLSSACRDMFHKGFVIEKRFVESGAFHCYIKFPEILYQTGISPLASRKILIRIDTEAKDKFYQPNEHIINRFALYRRILVAPASVLLAQKMMTVLERKREKGRDLFDVSYLSGLSKPDFHYIEKCNGTDKEQFLIKFDQRLQELDFEFLANDVEPFLFDSAQKERVLTFKEYWRTKSVG